MQHHCDDIVTLLSSYHDGELTADELDFVDHHLLECPACRAALGRLSRTVEAVAALPAVDVDSVVYLQDVRRRLDAGPSIVERIERLFEHRRLGSFAGLASVLVLTFVYTRVIPWHDDRGGPLRLLPGADAVTIGTAPTETLVAVVPSPAAAAPAIAVSLPPRPTAVAVATPAVPQSDDVQALPSTVALPPTLLAAHHASAAPSPSAVEGAELAFRRLASAAVDQRRRQGFAAPAPTATFTSGVDWDRVEVAASETLRSPGRPVLSSVPPRMATVDQVRRAFGPVVHVVGASADGVGLDLPFTGQILLEVNDMPAFFTAAAAEVAALPDFTLIRVNFDVADETELYLQHAAAGDYAGRFAALRDGLNGLQSVKGILSIQNDEDTGGRRVVKVIVRPVSLPRQ